MILSFTNTTEEVTAMKQMST